MGRVDPDLERAWRSPFYGLEAFCEAWRPGTSFRQNLEVVSGSVTMTDQPGVRATLTLQVAMKPGLFDALAPMGTLLRPVVRTRAGIRHWDSVFGTFEVEEQSLTYDGSGVLSLTAPDLWSRVINRRLDVPAIPTGNAVDWAVTAARQALRDEVALGPVAPSSATVRDVVYEDDRNRVVQELLSAANRVAYLDRAEYADWLPRLVVKPPPRVTGASVWSIDTFSDGVMENADRTRSSRPVRNRVIVRPAGTARFPQVTVDDTNPASPTRVDGPMGPRPVVVAHPAIRDASQALAYGRTVLARMTGLGADISITAAPHYGLDPGDLVSVTLPAQNGDGWATERHLVESVTHPFPTKGSTTGAVQSIKTRSSRPDGGDDEVVAA